MICPRPCSRLATAAVFISVGVVQFIVGIILLKSNYVYLLAGPDFWTASSNVIVGCLLGVSASVWRSTRKGRSDAKYVVRRNLLAALMVSALVVNATTAVLLILGEANTLLSIQLEKNGRSRSATFAGEILAYAYATSVCSPIICVVVSIVFLAGNCFQFSGEKEDNFRTPRSMIKKEYPGGFKWVYSPEKIPPPNVAQSFSLTSSSSEDSEVADSDDDQFIDALYACALYKMAKDKRDRAVSEATLYQQKLRNSLHHKGRSQRSSKVSFSDEVMNKRLSQKDRDRHFRHESRKSHRADSLGEDSSPIPDAKNSRTMPDDKFHTYRKNKQSPVENDVFYDLPLQLMAKNLEDDHCFSNRRVKMTSLSKQATRLGESNSPGTSEVSAEVHGNQKFEMLHEKYSRGLSSNKDIIYHQKTTPEDLMKSHYSQAGVDSSHQAAGSSKESSPGESDVDLDSTFDVSKVSLVGDVVPIRVNGSRLAKLSPRLVSVAIPVVPENFELKPTKSSSNEDGNKPQTKCSESCLGDPGNITIEQNVDLIASSDVKMSSFREVLIEMDGAHVADYPKEHQELLQSGTSKRARKSEASAKLSYMSPIPESKYEDIKSNRQHLSSARSSGYVSSPEEIFETPLDSDVLNLGFIGGEEQESACMASPQDTGITPKRTAHVSNKNAFRRLWSFGGADVNPKFLDLIVDSDSLIGLSKEDLVRRQLRNRSLRKIVEKRLKEERNLANRNDEKYIRKVEPGT